MASVTFSPASGAELDPTDTIRVTIDHDGSMVLLALLVQRSGDFPREAAHVGPQLVAPGNTVIPPYRATFVSSTGVQYVFDLERFDGGGWNFDFTIHCWVGEGVGGASNVTSTYTTSEPAPAVEIVDPGGTLAPEDAIDVQTTGDVGDNVLIIAAIGITDVGDLADARSVDTIFIGSTPLPPYTVTDMGGGLLRVAHEGGWPASFLMIAGAPAIDVDLDIQGVDVFPETVVDPGGAPSTSVTPAPGTQITTSTPLVVDVIDDSGIFRRVLLMVAYATGDLAGITELVHDGDAFVGYYSTGCTRDPIAGGFRFTILRDGGWPASPTLRVFAFDRGGNEV